MAAPALRSCATCGYLSLLNRSNEQHEEATVENRQRGLFKRDTCIHRARCSKGVRDLPSESLEAVRRLSTDRDSDNTRPDAILDTINKPRSESECRLWTPHFPNHTPKDHDQMMWQQMAMDAKERSADALARMPILSRDSPTFSRNLPTSTSKCPLGKRTRTKTTRNGSLNKKKRPTKAIAEIS